MAVMVETETAHQADMEESQAGCSTPRLSWLWPRKYGLSSHVTLQRVGPISMSISFSYLDDQDVFTTNNAFR